MNDWNPEQYLQFAEQRTRAASDLISRVQIPEARYIIDLGCGPGNSTALLRSRWPGVEIVGVDSDPAMIARARHDCPTGSWVLADAAAFVPDRPPDLVFSNALLQWIPHHEQILTRLLNLLPPGGMLAVQIPAFGDSPVHRALLEVAGRAPWRAVMQGCAEAMIVHPAEYYNAVLRPRVKTLDLWETQYFHFLPSVENVIDWYRSTGMRPFLQRLKIERDITKFEAEVLALCRADFRIGRDGSVLFPFRRLFFVAQR
jgi:trans-aconitate 2-methyltransferase